MIFDNWLTCWHQGKFSAKFLRDCKIRGMRDKKGNINDADGGIVACSTPEFL